MFQRFIQAAVERAQISAVRGQAKRARLDPLERVNTVHDFE